MVSRNRSWEKLAAGVPAEVSDRLGHARRSFTVDVYTHAVPSMASDAA